MFAGANSSGKSTLKSVINPALLGVYINPDDIEREIIARTFLDLVDYQVNTQQDEILPFFLNSTLLKNANLLDEASNPLKSWNGLITLTLSIGITSTTSFNPLLINPSFTVS